MTEDNKKTNIREELERAEEALKAASLLFDNGLLSDAISRLYYFVLHSVRALLLTEGLQPKSHAGALSLFGLHFVKKGVIEADVSHVFSKLMKYREEADYNPSHRFSREDFVESRDEAQKLSELIHDRLDGMGYI